MTTGKRVRYSGHVQGVGFRFTAQRLAQGFIVAGTVRNCSDGAVELVVQGEAEQVDSFLAALAWQMGDLIENQSIEEVAPTATTQGFHIIK